MKIMAMRKKICLIFLFFLGGYKLTAGEYVNIYFTDWNVARFVSFNENGVRNSPDVYIRIYNTERIRNLKQILRNASVLTGERTNFVDIVIDFVKDGKIYETYIINKFHFYKKGSLTYYSTPYEILSETYYATYYQWKEQ